MKMQKNCLKWKNNKQLIGMVHLKALPKSPNNEYSNAEIYKYAKKDLIALIEGGATAAIIENMFDTPYLTELDIETLVSYVNIFTKLKEISTIPLGVNLQATNNDEEMIIASLCGGDFIRVETLVEERQSSSGIRKALGAKILRKRKELNSNVKIFSDINVKHTYSISNQKLEDTIYDVLESEIDAVILTGLVTGKSPTVEDVKQIKKIIGKIPLIIGSGISKNNIKEFLKYVDGVIVGSSIKEEEEIKSPIDILKVKELSSIIN